MDLICDDVIEAKSFVNQVNEISEEVQSLSSLAKYLSEEEGY